MIKIRSSYDSPRSISDPGVIEFPLEASGTARRKIKIKNDQYLYK